MCGCVSRNDEEINNNKSKSLTLRRKGVRLFDVSMEQCCWLDIFGRLFYSMGAGKQ